MMRLKRKVVLIAGLTCLVLGACLTALFAVGMLWLWPMARTWTESTLRGREAWSSSQVTQLTGRLQELRRKGVDGATLAALAGEPGLAQLLRLTESVPALSSLVQDGTYQKALQEAVRQNVQQVTAVKLEQVASPEIRDAVTRVQRAFEGAPAGEKGAGTVDQAVLELLGTQAFAQICRDPNFFRLLGGLGDTAEAKE
jgi:hypothetical protein